MSWRNSIAAFLSLLALSACGFTPLYATKKNSDGTNFAGVIIETPSGRQGQLFKMELDDRLNPPGGLPAQPAYRLAVTLANTTTPIGVARDGTVSRYNIYLTSDYTLYRTSDNKEVATGSLKFINSYNNLTNAYFSTYVSEQDAIRRGITELAELYRGRLATALVKKP